MGPVQAGDDRAVEVQRPPDHRRRRPAPRDPADRLLRRTARGRPRPLDVLPERDERGASWDRELHRRVADAIGKEIRAQGGNLWGGLCVNLLRHPGGGARRRRSARTRTCSASWRCQCSGRAAAQRDGVREALCAQQRRRGRNHIDVLADERTLREVYLPHFKRAVDAGAASVMSAYNKVNGHYAARAASPARRVEAGLGLPRLRDVGLLRGHLRREEGRPGRSRHRDAGGGAVRRQLPELGRDGRGACVAVVDEAARRVLRPRSSTRRGRTRRVPRQPRARPRRPPRSRARPPSRASCCSRMTASCRSSARREARRGAGRLADVANLGDWGSSRVYPPDTVTPLQGLREVLGKDVDIRADAGDTDEAASGPPSALTRSS